MNQTRFDPKLDAKLAQLDELARRVSSHELSMGEATPLVDAICVTFPPGAGRRAQWWFMAELRDQIAAKLPRKCRVVGCDKLSGFNGYCSECLSRLLDSSQKTRGNRR